MAPGDDPQNSTPAQVRNYDANVPPYTLFNRVFPAYPSPRDFHEVGLDDMADGALQSTPQERVRMAREIRRAALDALFFEMYGQDVHTWEKCKKTFSRRMEEGDNTWIDNTIELVLREKELKDPMNTAEPQYADRATFHLAEQFFTKLNGTVWLETASNDDAEPMQEKVDAVQKYRDSLVVPVKNEITALQNMLFKSCRMADFGRPSLYREYEAKAVRVKEEWECSEEARMTMLHLP